MNIYNVIDLLPLLNFGTHSFDAWIAKRGNGIRREASRTPVRKMELNLEIVRVLWVFLDFIWVHHGFIEAVDSIGTSF